MSYKPYAKYKPSGVEWLGEIPEGWNSKGLKHVSKIVSGATPKSSISEFWDGDNVWITPVDLGKCTQKVIAGSARKLTDLGVESCGTEITPNGSIIISTRAPIGHIALSEVESCINQGCKTIVPQENESKDYLYYFLKSAVEELQSCGQGSTFMELPTHRLKDLLVPFPSLPEQTQIATFLDRKTTQIDKLIEIKRKQIELLKEERTAIINQAVTKGLNPDAKMKESGIEWIGEIPEGWEIGRFKHSVSIVNGQVDPRLTEHKKLTLIAPNHIEKGTGRLLFTESAEDQGADSGKYLFSESDVLYSKIRPALQKACLANDIGLCSADMYPLTVNENLRPKFLLYHLLSARFTHFAVTTSERVAMPKINRESLSEYSFPLPTICEQDALVDYIEKNHKVIDSSITKAQQQIQLLKEYRTTLISDAVTGKIDIREEAA